MKNIQQESLITAMQYLGIRNLPEVEDKSKIWVKSLALVRKADGSMSYAVIEKDCNAKNKCVADFGNISAIKEYIEYYPISYLQDSYLPKFKTKGKEERIKHLCLFGGYSKEELEKKSVKELDNIVITFAIKQQLKSEKQTW